MFMEKAALLSASAAMFPLAWADVAFTKPAAGDVVTGTSLVAEWKESNHKPPISTFSSYQLFLCAGGNNDTDFIPLFSLQGYGTYTEGSKWQGPVSPGWGANDSDAYFLRMTSTSACGGTLINYSKRFTLSSMTGSFPPNVLQGLQSLGTDTNGPPTDQSGAGTALSCTSSVAAEPATTTVGISAATASRSVSSITRNPPSASASSSSRPSSNSITLSTGALAGIVVTSILLFAMIAGIALFIFLRIRKRRMHPASPKLSVGKAMLRLDSTDRFAELSETAVCKEMEADKRQPTELGTAVRAELPTRTSVYEMPAS